MSSLLGRSVCAKSSSFVVGSSPAAEASSSTADGSTAAAANLLVVGTGAGRVVSATADFFAVDRVDFDPVVSARSHSEGQRRPAVKATRNWPPPASTLAVTASPGTSRENRSTSQSAAS